jgi:membrane protein YdbS with pleckstrin-like domain
VIIANESLVPYHRIQQIDVERGPLDRLLGLSSLVLRTASATTDGKIPGIPAATADALRVRLLTRAGADDAV